MMEVLMIIFAAIAFSAIAGLALATANKTVSGLFIGWAVIGGILGYLGFFQNTTSLPPRFVFLIIPASAILIYAMNKVDIKKTHLTWLLMIHLLRIPIELILFQLYEKGMIPQSMTYEGWNYDIFSGLSALLILGLHHFDKLPIQLLRIWNWMALSLLLVIVATAILSAPSQIQLLAFHQPNRAVLVFPFTWLPSIVVPIVLLSHLLIFKKIRMVESGRTLWPTQEQKAT